MCGFVDSSECRFYVSALDLSVKAKLMLEKTANMRPSVTNLEKSLFFNCFEALKKRFCHDP